MRILILGGTGAMGNHLVELFRDTDNEIVITTRANRRSSYNIKYITGNTKDDEFLNKILHESWDTIIDFMVYTTIEFKNRINQLLNATSKYIFLSSSRVYADSKEKSKKPHRGYLTYQQIKNIYLKTNILWLKQTGRYSEKFREKQLDYNKALFTYSLIDFKLGILEKKIVTGTER